MIWRPNFCRILVKFVWLDSWFDGGSYSVIFVGFRDVGPAGEFLVQFRFLVENVEFHMELISISGID